MWDKGDSRNSSSWSLKEFSSLLFYGLNGLFGRTAFQEAGNQFIEEWVMVNGTAFKQSHLYIIK